ncbi:MAG: efflux RND transporter periplasmic adaptor subunit [Cytophagales bacterium]|nr:MAG: efflux RND transporter periplasmic adaptor subunit [Cytophagales bacterium]TAF59204.1 MAG: efflux RND transporter periplasmic adaptor subunit [Cytophagales bacterium]
MKYHYSIRFIAILISFAISITACQKEPRTDEEKKAQLIKFKKELATIQAKINTLEKDLTKTGAIVSSLRAVELLSLDIQAFNHYIEIQGNINTEQNVLVMPEMPGVITSLNVKEGQQVSKGQVLARFDAETLRKNVEELQNRLVFADDVFKRRENLWKQGIGSEVQYLEAKNQKESIEKSISTVKSQMSKYSARAPISGIAEEVFVKQGEVANMGMPLARIVNLGQMFVEADVAEAYLTNLKVNDKVTVSIPALNRELEAKITRIGQTINAENRTFSVRIDLPNKDNLLKPNVVAIVKINDFNKAKAVSIPSNLIQQGTDGNKFVLAAETSGNKTLVKKYNIKTGMAYKGRTLIEEGLKGDEKLIFKGYNEVSEGEEVQVNEATTAEATASSAAQ